MNKYKYEYQSDFAKKYYGDGHAEGIKQGREEGRQEGREEGREEGLREAVVEAARAKIPSLTADEEAIIRSAGIERLRVLMTVLVTGDSEAVRAELTATRRNGS